MAMWNELIKELIALTITHYMMTNRLLLIYKMSFQFFFVMNFL